MKIIRVKDYEEMTRELLELYVGQIERKPDSVLSFTTGAAPRGLLEKLAQRIQEGLDVSRRIFCNLDEYVCRKDQICSVYHFMNSYLYDRIDRKPGKILMFDGEAEDREAELARYKALLDQYPRHPSSKSIRILF